MKNIFIMVRVPEGLSVKALMFQRDYLFRLQVIARHSPSLGAYQLSDSEVN